MNIRYIRLIIAFFLINLFFYGQKICLKVCPYNFLSYAQTKEGRVANLKPYPQIFVKKIKLKECGSNVYKVFLLNKTNLCLLTEKGVCSYSLKDGKESFILKKPSYDIKVKEGKVYIGSVSGIFVYDKSIKRMDYEIAVGIPNQGAIFVFKDKIFLSTVKGLYILEEERINKVEFFNDKYVNDIMKIDEQILISTIYGVYEISGRKFKKIFDYDITSMDAYQDELSFASGSFILILNKKDCKILKKIDVNKGLPYPGIKKVLYDNKGRLYIGTRKGLIRYDRERFNYFHSERYLLDDEVNDLFVDKENKVYVGTKGGVSIIQEREIKLEEKAEIFEEMIEKRHIRDGFVRKARLKRRGDVNDIFLPHSDNDGLWNSLYIAAMCFKYGATKDKSALDVARRGFKTLKWLVEITGIPGFPARSIVPIGEPKRERYGGEWHKSNDGVWEWKGDTSSDEINGHFFAYSIYYDLCAETKEEKEEVREVTSKIMDHIIDNNFYLIDVDGKPTRWGVWNPNQLNRGRPLHGYLFWKYAGGLNSLEILSYLKASYHITGDEKYEKVYKELIEKHHYDRNTVGQKLIEPKSIINHSDDELAFLAYYPLLLYEKDDNLRDTYLKSLERTWQFERPERNPWWNFTYCIFNKEKDCDIENSVRTLKEITLDLITWRIDNSHRFDIKIDPSFDRHRNLQSLYVLPYNEQGMFRWNGNPYRLIQGNGGWQEEEGTFFLLPYWMGRYYGFIQEK